MAAIKIVANTVAVTTAHAQITDSRIQRIYNSNTTVVANVEFGANSTSVTKMITVGPGDTVMIDVGALRDRGGDQEIYISINAACENVYRTPVSNG